MMKRMLAWSRRASADSRDWMLVLERHQVRLLQLEGDLLQCVAEGPNGPPEPHAVGRFLNAQLGQGLRGTLRVVIAANDQRVELETLPRTSRRDRALLLRQRLNEHFPDTELHIAQALPGPDKTHVRYRLMAVGQWPALDQWLAWLSDLPCRVQGLYLSSALVADALSDPSAEAGSIGAARHRLALVRTADAGAMILVMTAGVLRLVRHLDAVVCGGSDNSEERAQALAGHIEQSRQWLQQQDGDSPAALVVDVLDKPMVNAYLAAWRETAGTEHGGLARLCEPLALQQLPANLLGDAVLWAALARTRTQPLEPPHWIGRHRQDRRAAHLTWAAATAAGVGAVVLGWQGLELRTEQAQLRSAQATQVEQAAALAASQTRRTERDTQLQAMAGEQEVASFEQRAKAYRALLQSPDAHEQTNELLRAVGEAIGRSSLTLQRLRISHEGAAIAPSLELGFIVPAAATRADAIAEIRHVSGILQDRLPRHLVDTTGLENLRNPPADRRADPFADPAPEALGMPASGMQVRRTPLPRLVQVRAEPRS